MSNIGRIRYEESTSLSHPAIIKRRGWYTRDEMMTYDRLTIDNAGAFLIGELERLDQTVHDPLVSFSWGRDIDVREDVTVADEFSSFTNSSFASPGGVTPNGIAWISKDANAISGIALDIGKTAQPLDLWGMELKWTLPELDSARKLGRPIDEQKFQAMQIKYQMDIDQLVYIGDPLKGSKGLINSTPTVVATNAAMNASSHTTWVEKIADDTTGDAGSKQILADVNALIYATWEASAFAVMPDRVLLPPAAYGLLVSTLISSAGNQSVIAFLEANSLVMTSLGKKLEIQPVKWLTGAGAGLTNRMMAYSRDRNRVRFPMTTLSRTPLEYRSLFQITTYYGRLGQVEIVYPETIRYMDGI